MPVESISFGCGYISKIDTNSGLDDSNAGSVFVTINVATPGSRIKSDGMMAEIEKASINVVTSGIEFQETTDEDKNPDPVIVIVRSGPPAIITAGLMVSITTVFGSELGSGIGSC